MKRSALIAAVVAWTFTTCLIVAISPGGDTSSITARFAPAGTLEAALESPDMHRRGPGDVRIVFLGDSTAMNKTAELALPALLNVSLSKADKGRRFSVAAVTFPGLDAFSFYPLAESICRAGPEIVVLTLNLSTLRAFRAKGSARPELGGWIWPRDIPRALGLPFEVIGLTADRMLFYSALVNLNLSGVWASLRVVQGQVDDAWRALALRADQLAGYDATRAYNFKRQVTLAERFTTPPPRRHTRAGAERAYGVVLDGLGADNRVLEVWSATVKKFSDAGIRTFVYVAPINVDRLRDLGLVGAGAKSSLPASIKVLTQALAAAGGELVDTHGLLVDAEFRDTVHFSAAGGERLAVKLADDLLGGDGRFGIDAAAGGDEDRD